MASRKGRIRGVRKCIRASVYSFMRRDQMNRLSEELITSADDIFRFRTYSRTETRLSTCRRAHSHTETTLSACRRAFSHTETALSACRRAFPRTETTLSACRRAHFRTETRLSACRRAHSHAETRLSACRKAHSHTETALPACRRAFSRTETRLSACRRAFPRTGKGLRKGTVKQQHLCARYGIQITRTRNRGASLLILNFRVLNSQSIFIRL